MVSACGLKQFTQSFYFQGCLAPIKVLIPPGSILQPSQNAAVVGGNVLTSQRVVDVIFRAFEVCAASQVRELEKMHYVSSLRQLYSFFFIYFYHDYSTGLHEQHLIRKWQRWLLWDGCWWSRRRTSLEWKERCSQSHDQHSHHWPWDFGKTVRLVL